MSFLAKLFLDNTERKILNADILIRQATDWLGRPESMPEGGLINLKIESTYETMFWEWIVSPTMMKEGYIRFYKRDGMSKLTDLEFWDCYLVDYYELYNDNSNEPLELYLTLSAGIIRFKNTVFEKNWKITNINLTTDGSYSYLDDLAEREKKEEVKKEIEEMYFTDLNGKRLKDLAEKKVKLIVKTKNMVGDRIDINFNNNTFNFKYQNEILDNDLLENYLINSETEEITLDVIEDEERESQEV